jgi:hypothetical protein
VTLLITASGKLGIAYTRLPHVMAPCQVIYAEIPFSALKGFMKPDAKAYFP